LPPCPATTGFTRNRWPELLVDRRLIAKRPCR